MDNQFEKTHYLNSKKNYAKVLILLAQFSMFKITTKDC